MTEPTQRKRTHQNGGDNGNGNNKKNKNKKMFENSDSDSDNHSNKHITENSIIPTSFISAIKNKQNQQKLLSQALLLDFNNTDNNKRAPRQRGGQYINIQEKKHVDTLMKWKIIAIAGILGWSPSSANEGENKKAAMAAINLVCYDNGMKPISYTAFCEWASSINDSLEGEKDNLGDDLLERKKKIGQKISH